MKHFAANLLILVLLNGCIGITGTATVGTIMPQENRDVTLTDNGKTIILAVNDSFLLKLGESYDWVITIGNESVLSRVMSIAIVRGAQGVFSAHEAGRTFLQAVGDPACRNANPPCEAPSLSFRVTIVVK
jgi:hypothetical protein